jgi:hypothetical protein
MGLPDEGSLRWIVTEYARLRAGHGDAIGSPPLVQPTSAFFPDEFSRDAPSVARLLHRIMSYAPIADDLPVELAFEAAGVAAAGCGSLACESREEGDGGPRVEEREDGYRVWLGAAELSEPTALAASLARAVGAMVLFEAGAERRGPEAGPAGEVAAAACGFGVLLANGAAIWAKSCGGLRMAKVTAMSVDEIALCLALFVGVGDARPAEARAHLGTTQREAFELALSWVDSNPRLLDVLRTSPESLHKGRFAIEPIRGAFGRWLERRRIEREPADGRT